MSILNIKLKPNGDSEMRPIIKAGTIVLVSLGVLTSLSFLLWPYVAYSSTERDFIKNIQAKITEGSLSFSVKDLTNFDWDTVCFYDYGYNALNDLDKLRSSGIKTISPKHFEKIKSLENQSDILLLIFGKRGNSVEVIYNYSDILKINDTKYFISSELKNCSVASRSKFEVQVIDFGRNLILKEE